jgi:hypothetical protein
MRFVIRCCVLLILIAGLWSSASGQASSTNFTLVSGSLVASAGTALSTTTAVTGVIPTSVTGTSISTNYTAVSGSIGIMHSLAARYAGNAMATVTPADQLLKVAYVGDTGTASGTVYYRQMGQTNYSSGTMITGTGDTLEYTCPAELFTISGLEYYFQVRRGASVTQVARARTPLVYRVQLTNDAAQRPQATPTRSYRMISLPLNVDGTNTVQAVFSDDLGTYNRELWRLGRWDPATEDYIEYPSASSVVPGRGYWLITDAADTYGAAGISVRPNRVSVDSVYYTVPLLAGWNQVGNPYPFMISFNDVLFDDNGTILDRTDDLSGVIEDAAYSYNGSSYEAVTVVDAWSGMFVNALKSGVALLIKCQAAGVVTLGPAKGGMIAASDNPEWRLELSMKAGDKADVGNFAGVHPEALEGADRFDFCEPPMAPEGCLLAFRLPGEETALRRIDYRPDFSDGSTWEVVFSAGTDRELTVSGVNGIPDGMQAWLIYNVGQTVRLENEVAVRIPNDVSSALLVVGKDPFVRSQVSQVMPNDYALNQNFPNPFNPSTAIRFALPRAAQVELVVYNTLGQKVATVVDGEMGAGHHAVVWEGRNDGGQAVASGVYFYRLSAGDFHQTRKMMLLK